MSLFLSVDGAQDFLTPAKVVSITQGISLLWFSGTTVAQLSLKRPKPFISINRVVLPLLKSNQRCCSGKSQIHRGKAGYLSCPFSDSRSFWGRTGLTVVLVSRAQNPPGGTLPFLLEPSRLPPPPPPLRLSKAWRSHLASPRFQAPAFASVTCWLQVASSSCQGALVVEQTDG